MDACVGIRLALRLKPLSLQYNTVRFSIEGYGGGLFCAFPQFCLSAACA